MSADDESEKPNRARLADVAGLAGVSVSTVSKVFNGRPGVSPQTRSRVETLLQHRGYSRRSSTQAPLLEVLIHQVGTPFAGELLTAMERLTRCQGIGLVVTGVEDDQWPAPAWIDAVLERRPLGVVVMAAQLHPKERRRLRARNIPVVGIDTSWSLGGDPYVGSANWQGGYLATHHLIDLGHRSIGAITGRAGILPSSARLSGYRAALDEAGLPLRRELIRPGRFVREDGLTEGRALLQLDQPPTAIFAGSDFQALGVYEAARQLGVRIPDDLSVVGYDDIALAEWAGPPMTTVRVPMAEVVEHVSRLIDRLREDPDFDASPVELATTLMIRGSTAAPSLR